MSAKQGTFPKNFKKWMENITERVKELEEYSASHTNDGRWQDKNHPILS